MLLGGLARLACLACLACAADAQRLLYTSTLEKAVGDGGAAGDVAGFSIPGGQCSGYLDQSLLCGARRATRVRVSVRDAAFAALRIDDALRSATVTRARCDAAADVELRLACDGDDARRDEDAPRRRRRRRAAPLPPADSVQ